jgi:GTP cyclohydrolase II
MNILAAVSMKQNKLKRHLQRVHAECVGKTREFFHRKRNEFINQKKHFKKIKLLRQKNRFYRSKLTTELPNVKNLIRMEEV